VRVIAQSTLAAFWRKHPDAEKQLRAWYEEAETSTWETTTDIQGAYPRASILKDGRAVFNIGGNKYRLVVQCRKSNVYVCFIGTHAEYDKIDAQAVWNHRGVPDSQRRGSGASHSRDGQTAQLAAGNRRRGAS
jgi:mRNA interferase HigB